MKYFFVVILLIFITSCQEQDEQSSEPLIEDKTPIREITETNRSAKLVANLASIGHCNHGKRGQLIYVTDEKNFYTCTKSDWLQIDIMGAQGTSGKQGPRGERGPAGGPAPYLVDGDGSVIGDRLVSYKVNKYGVPEYVSIWEANTDTIISYGHGGVSAGGSEIYYKSSNCTGSPYRLSGQNLTTSPLDGLGAIDWVIHFDGQFYKLTNKILQTRMSSHRNSSGSACQTYSHNDRVYQKMEPISPDVPIKLQRGWKIKFR